MALWRQDSSQFRDAKKKKKSFFKLSKKVYYEEITENQHMDSGEE